VITTPRIPARLIPPRLMPPRLVLVGALALAGLCGLADSAFAAPPTASVKASIKKQVLTVTGTPSADTIALRLQAGAPDTLEIDVNADGSAELRFTRDRFNTIVVNGAAGDDRLLIDQVNGVFTDTEATTLDGGNGADTLIGGYGPERLLGGNGNDFINGRLGSDLIDAGDGDDVFQWDPGDGSDVVNGGAGADRVVFNGSSASETLAFAPGANGHVVLTRDIGSVTADLDGIETMDLRTSAGTDIVTVNDLTGTDLTTINTDLAAAGGGDDAAIDEVIVPPGFPISRDGSAAVVDGLGAQVRVVNGFGLDAIHVTGTAAVDTVPVVGTAEADSIQAIADGTDVVVQGATPGVLVRLTTIERLSVDLLGGDDMFSAAGNLAALTSLVVDGGDGADTIIGSNGADVLTGGNGNDFINGRLGSDLIDAGDGDDVFQWDPGDGSDVVNGGAGADRVVFNGSSASETFAFAPGANGHVVLTRDIGSVTADLDGIETMDLRTSAGTDHRHRQRPHGHRPHHHQHRPRRRRRRRRRRNRRGDRQRHRRQRRHRRHRRRLSRPGSRTGHDGPDHERRSHPRPPQRQRPRRRRHHRRHARSQCADGPEPPAVTSCEERPRDLPGGAPGLTHSMKMTTASVTLPAPRCLLAPSTAQDVYASPVSRLPRSRDPAKPLDRSAASAAHTQRGARGARGEGRAQRSEDEPVVATKRGRRATGHREVRTPGEPENSAGAEHEAAAGRGKPRDASTETAATASMPATA
jgi:Ca2+-binding RTX toxin-like protein